MMRTFLSFCLAFCFIVMHAQTAKPASVTFAVCDVKQKPTHIPMTTYKAAVDKHCGSGVEAWSRGTDSLLFCNFHPFVASVQQAYLNHRPLTLSPDMIWLLIAQQFAIHVDMNGDSLRHYFVDFDGKKVLQVERDEFVKGSPDNDWAGVFPDFTKQIGEYTGKDLLNTTVLNFSTTGPTQKAAFEVTLMDAMSSYFIYEVVSIGCGIPKVTLEGTPQDWEMLRTKALLLKKYDYGWWIDSLAPVLNQFVDASKGKVDVNFWARIYDNKAVLSGGGCGGMTSINYVTGWITKFFPYLPNGKKPDGTDNFRKRTNLSEPVNPEAFTTGMASADFYWYYAPDGGSPTLYQMQFLAGFLGATIQPDGGVRPEIGWAIRDTGKQGVKDGDKEYSKEIMNPHGK